MATDVSIYFGGPDQANGYLRDILADRIAKVPSGGTIDWVAYYFRDRRLAHDLVRAKQRGVSVGITLESKPRTTHANEAVGKILSEGLGRSFRAIAHTKIPTPLGKYRSAYLHEKLFCFSHPQPIALLGSFNPSGDEPETDPEAIHEIGDHDRGHNALVQFSDSRLIRDLQAHARQLNQARHSPFERFTPTANRPLRGPDFDMYFWPRFGINPILSFLRRLDPRSRLRIAASHLKGKTSTKTLKQLARRGIKIEILTDSTERRVPRQAATDLEHAGISVRRVILPEPVPMHNKFVLAEQAGERWTIFGSFNWTARSHWLNHEIGVISWNKKLFDNFAKRWEIMKELSA